VASGKGAVQLYHWRSEEYEMLRMHDHAGAHILPCSYGGSVSGIKMKLVILESPYAGDIEGNTIYARDCVRDSLRRGESPIASHLLYTQPGILNENIPAERLWGIEAGHAWLKHADLMAVYEDWGLSGGVKAAIKKAEAIGLPIEYRRIR